VGCANEFLGAKKIIYKGGFYVERWFLSPDYSESDVPSGTAFYGAAANKIKNRFDIKYYVRDDENSELIIPKKDMWSINHNGKRFNKQDDDDLYYYFLDSVDVYKKYINKGASRPLTVRNGSIIPIKSCDINGWCKVYPNRHSNDLYVKETILKEPLSNI
jgi:hypothetical protein